MDRDQIIRDTAYAIWEAEGRPDGRADEHWRMAEANVVISSGVPERPAKPAKRVADRAASTAGASAKAAMKPAATETAPAAAPAKKAGPAKTAKAAPKPKA